MFVQEAFESKESLLNRLFIIFSDDVNVFWLSIPRKDFYYINITLKIHEFVLAPENNYYIFAITTSCACKSCI